MKKQKKNSKFTFTKWVVSFLLVVAVIDLQLTYILAFLGSPDTLQETSGKLITEILGVVLVYCIKSFFETREEEKNKLIKSTAEALNKDLESDPDFNIDYFNNS